MEIIYYSLIAGAILIGIRILHDLFNKIKIKSEPNNQDAFENNYYPYKKKYLLTKSEYFFYNELLNRIQYYNIVICPKVRLEDFIDVTDKQHKQKYRGYIKSRHVDFLLCDNKLNIIGAVELDDPSHESSKAQKTDEFKNNVYKTIGINLYRITYKDDYALQINNMLKELVSNYDLTKE